MLPTEVCAALADRRFVAAHLRLVLAIAALVPNGRPKRLYVEEIAKAAKVHRTTANVRLIELSRWGVLIRKGQYGALTKLQLDPARWSIPEGGSSR